MPLTPRNIICDGPDVMSDVLLSALYTPTGIDASPIYGTINATCGISGSYTNPNTGDKFTYSNTLTPNQSNRVGLRDSTLLAELENYEFTRDHGEESAWGDVFMGDSQGVDEFQAIQGTAISSHGRVVPFSPPRFSADIYKYDSDIDSSVTFLPPSFRGTIEGGDLEMVVSIGVSMNISDGASAYTDSMSFAVDASLWGSPEFRDITGTYGDTTIDSKGITYTWSVTVG